jgi:hypothetical protein
MGFVRMVGHRMSLKSVYTCRRSETGCICMAVVDSLLVGISLSMCVGLEVDTKWQRVISFRFFAMSRYWTVWLCGCVAVWLCGEVW